MMLSWLIFPIITSKVNLCETDSTTDSAFRMTALYAPMALLEIAPRNGEAFGDTRQEHLAGKRRCNIRTPLGKHRIEAHDGGDFEIACKVKRVGGGFGGKCSQSLPPGAWAAVAARTLNRPVSVVLSRKEDMLITGKRHPATVKYRVGADSDGLLRCAYLKFYVDGGFATDLSPMVTFLSSALADACYRIPVMRTEGYTLKTNKSNNTAFRGFGVPQAFYAMDCILSHVAHAVRKPLEEIMELNFNSSGGTAFMGNPILNDNLMDCWKECMKWSDFTRKREEIEKFNWTSKSIKRGIAMSATRMGLTHAGPYEQAAALVQICLDGSVAVSIGGVEMGQGLNTKCLQVTSRALGVPLSMITIIDASTDKTCNSPETGGSQGADIHCRAIQLLSVDIVMDVGHSLNPAVDIGQIEGAFMQSYGYFTTEEVTYDEHGHLVQNSLGKYKLPTPAMTPKRFRLKLLKNSDCFKDQVYSSKGIGEPPMMLGVGAFASLRFAITARLQDLGISEFQEITAPLTAAKIYSYCNPE